MTQQITPRTVITALLPATGEVPLADIYDTANLAGLADQPVRLAIRRLVSSGDAIQTGRGRAGTLARTDQGHQRLKRDHQSIALAFAQDTGEAPWDGCWHLFAVTVPESARAARDTLRRELYDLGAVSISTGLYLSPHNLIGALSTDARQYLTTASTKDLDLRGTTDSLAITEMLWPRNSTVLGYAAVSEALRVDAATPHTPVIVRKLLLADALERAMRDDPLIPSELRGASWPPTLSRSDWLARWDSLENDDNGPAYRGW